MANIRLPSVLIIVVVTCASYAWCTKINWKQRVICPDNQAIKHIKNNQSENGIENWYFACGKHETIDLEDECPEESKDNDIRKERKTIYYDDPRHNDKCDQVYSNVSQVQTFDNGTKSEDDCVWRSECIVNIHHQEIARGARFSTDSKTAELYCCLSSCLMKCGDNAIEKTNNQSIKSSQILSKFNKEEDHVCYDCGGWMDAPARGLIIAKPCSYARPAHSYQSDHYEFGTGDIDPGLLWNNQGVSFSCLHNFVSLGGIGSRFIICFDNKIAFDSGDEYPFDCIPCSKAIKIDPIYATHLDCI